MGIADRRARDRAEREARIVAVARAIAEREGWSAVTVRRLADEIEYSQPVLYGHFESRDAIISAVAVEGFRELAEILQTAAKDSSGVEAALDSVATAYLDFAFDHPALYEAMFVLSVGLRFAQADTPPELRSAFTSLAAVIGRLPEAGDTATEAFWAALHGLAELESRGRIRPAARRERLKIIVRAFVALGSKRKGPRYRHAAAKQRCA